MKGETYEKLCKATSVPFAGVVLRTVVVTQVCASVHPARDPTATRAKMPSNTRENIAGICTESTNRARNKRNSVLGVMPQILPSDSRMNKGLVMRNCASTRQNDFASSGSFFGVRESYHWLAEMVPAEGRGTVSRAWPRRWMIAHLYLFQSQSRRPC